MNLRQHIATVLVLTAAAVGGPAPLAAAAPTPWETSRRPGTVRTVSGYHGNSVTLRCGNPCYQ
ncbi:hypothetical protein [Streptomyces sp. NPDC050287]|uniref:hypothetical protein n=1 Tax=Streptomyces sp. NPDC050287 TaxID=3365608 RepID=UPI0037961A89